MPRLESIRLYHRRFSEQMSLLLHISEEPMTKVTGFQQSVRLFQSYDPVTPSILSSFLLHLSDALPSGRVLLRLSVRHPYADSPAAVQAF